jgi:hypothetical protein
MNNSDQFINKLISAEADIIAGFSSFQDTFGKYADVFFKIDFSADNAEVVNRYFSGLDSLHNALGALIESSKIVACIKGVELNSAP